MLFPLDETDKGHLKRLNDNKPLIFALKKLFLNTAIIPATGDGTKLSSDVQTLAAERIAIDIINDAFHQLTIIQPSVRSSSQEENMV